jgi:hypothetical protein
MLPVKDELVLVGWDVGLGRTGVAVSSGVAVRAMAVAVFTSTSGVTLGGMDVGVSRPTRGVGLGRLDDAAGSLDVGTLQLINIRADATSEMKTEKDLDRKKGCLDVIGYSSLKSHQTSIESDPEMDLYALW